MGPGPGRAGIGPGPGWLQGGLGVGWGWGVSEAAGDLAEDAGGYFQSSGPV